MNPIQFVRFPAGGRWLGFVLLIALLALGGCARRQSPLPFRYDAGGIPHAFKRVEVYPQRDFFHHCVRKVYRRADQMFAPCGAEQEQTVQEWGRPDWVRKPFRSLENEKIVEWIYIDKGHLFQFVGTGLVYDGPLTDYEQTLLARGYPDHAHMVLRENGEREDLFVYNKLFVAWLEQFKFRDGKIVQSQEGY